MELRSWTCRSNSYTRSIIKNERIRKSRTIPFCEIIGRKSWSDDSLITSTNPWIYSATPWENIPWRTRHSWWSIVKISSCKSKITCGKEIAIHACALSKLYESWICISIDIECSKSVCWKDNLEYEYYQYSYSSRKKQTFFIFSKKTNERGI